MRLLFIGDVVGRAGSAAILAGELPKLRAAWEPRFRRRQWRERRRRLRHHRGGLRRNSFRQRPEFHALGNHAFDQREALVFIARQPRLHPPRQLSARARPAAAPIFFEAKGGAQRARRSMCLGRVFMDALDDPFAAHRRETRSLFRSDAGCDAAVVDMHAEATRAKSRRSRDFVDGRVSLVVGTHTHVPTADWRILPARHGLHDTTPA